MWVNVVGRIVWDVGSLKFSCIQPLWYLRTSWKARGFNFCQIIHYWIMTCINIRRWSQTPLIRVQWQDKKQWTNIKLKKNLFKHKKKLCYCASSQTSTGCKPEQPAAVLQSTLSRGGWTTCVQRGSFNCSVNLWAVAMFLRCSSPRLSESCKWSVTTTWIFAGIWLHHQAGTGVEQP